MTLRLSCLVLALMVVFGCAEKSFEEQVVEARSKYVVELNGCVLQKAEAPALDEAPAAVFGEEAEASAEVAPEAATEMEGEEGEGEEMAAMPAEPSVSRAMCDVVVRYSDRNPLPGVTIDLTHEDPFGEVRNTYREFVETSGLMKGDVRQASLELEVPGYEEGDGFTLEIRANVPAAERAEYREFTPPTE